jgi:hypothetical protein
LDDVPESEEEQFRVLSTSIMVRGKPSNDVSGGVSCDEIAERVGASLIAPTDKVNVVDAVLTPSESMIEMSTLPLAFACGRTVAVHVGHVPLHRTPPLADKTAVLLDV